MHHLGYLVVSETHLLREELNLFQDVSRHTKRQETRQASDHFPERHLQAAALFRKPPGVNTHPAHTTQQVDVGTVPFATGETRKRVLLCVVYDWALKRRAKEGGAGDHSITAQRSPCRHGGLARRCPQSGVRGLLRPFQSRPGDASLVGQLLRLSDPPVHSPK